MNTEQIAKRLQESSFTPALYHPSEEIKVVRYGEKSVSRDPSLFGKMFIQAQEQLETELSTLTEEQKRIIEKDGLLEMKNVSDNLSKFSFLLLSYFLFIFILL